MAPDYPVFTVSWSDSVVSDAVFFDLGIAMFYVHMQELKLLDNRFPVDVSDCISAVR